MSRIQIKEIANLCKVRRQRHAGVQLLHWTRVAYKWHHKNLTPLWLIRWTIPWTTSLRAPFVNSSMRYSAINFAIWWPLWLKMMEKSHMYQIIIVIQSFKEGSNLMGFSCRKAVNHTPYLHNRKKYCYYYGASPTRKSASQQKKYSVKSTAKNLIQFVALL